MASVPLSCYLSKSLSLLLYNITLLRMRITPDLSLKCSNSSLCALLLGGLCSFEPDFSYLVSIPYFLNHALYSNLCVCNFSCNFIITKSKKLMHMLDADLDYTFCWDLSYFMSLMKITCINCPMRHWDHYIKLDFLVAFYENNVFVIIIFISS